MTINKYFSDLIPQLVSAVKWVSPFLYSTDMFSFSLIVFRRLNTILYPSLSRTLIMTMVNLEHPPAFSAFTIFIDFLTSSTCTSSTGPSVDADCVSGLARLPHTIIH